MARLYYLKVKGGEHGEFECNELQDYYDKLECDCFDVARMFVGGKLFDLYVDDEGLLKETIIPGVIDTKTGEPLLAGNVVFANHNSAGETTSLSNDDIRLIRESLVRGLVFLDDTPTLVTMARASYER